MSDIKRLLYRILALALLAPTLLAGYAALTARQDELPIIFGMWMFLGLFPALGAVGLFRASTLNAAPVGGSP